jgi:circadian clock protein KaiB
MIEPIRPTQERRRSESRDGGDGTSESGGSRKKKSEAGRKRKTAGGEGSTWNLRLYVAGRSPKSQAALANLQRLCEKHIPGRYRIEVVDLLKNPRLAKIDEILAIPTLVRKLPVPVKRVIGDLSDSERAIVALDLRPVVEGSKHSGEARRG